MFKAVTRKIRRCVQAADAVMANKNDLPIFWPPRHDLLHQLLGKKGGALDVNRVPLFPTPNIDQRNLLARLQPFSNFLGRDLHLLISILSRKNSGDGLVYRKVLVARTHRCQGFIRTEPATRATPNVVGPEEGSLSGRIFLEKFLHRRTRVDCSRHAHSSQRYIISPENQKDRLLNDSKI
jgi:hypothetical protein